MRRIRRNSAFKNDLLAKIAALQEELAQPVTQNPIQGPIPLTKEELITMEELIESLVRKYPDFPISDVYPELVYKVLSEKYSDGEISKGEFDSRVEKIIENFQG